jgi:hypothetical protein
MTLRSTSGEVLHRFDLQDERSLSPHAVVPQENGRILAGMLSTGLYEWDREGRERQPFRGRTQQISEIHVSGSIAVTLGYFSEDEADTSLSATTSKLQAWDLERRELLWTVSAGRPPENGPRYALPYSFGRITVCERGVVCGTGDAKDQIALRDLHTGAERWRIQACPYAHAAQISGDRLRLLAPERGDITDPPAILYGVDMATGAVVKRIDLPLEGIRSAVFVGELVAASAGGALVILDAERGEEVARFEGVEGELAARNGVLCATTRDGRIAAFEI